MLCASADTCGLVQCTLVRKRQQTVGGVLEARLHPHLTHRNSVFQLTASNPNPTLCHIWANVYLQVNEKTQMKWTCWRKTTITLERPPHQKLFSVRSCLISIFGGQQLKVELKARVWIHHSTVLAHRELSLSEPASVRVKPRTRGEY